MDSIISMGQKYLSGQSGGSGGSSGGFDFSSLASMASQHDTQNSGDSDLFGNGECEREREGCWRGGEGRTKLMSGRCELR
jgi:hypothetical protein